MSLLAKGKEAREQLQPQPPTRENCSSHEVISLEF